jgi:hypothetical protein
VEAKILFVEVSLAADKDVCKFVFTWDIFHIFPFKAYLDSKSQGKKAYCYFRLFKSCTEPIVSPSGN